MSFPWDLEHKDHFTVWIREHFATRHTEKIESRQMGWSFSVRDICIAMAFMTTLL